MVHCAIFSIQLLLKKCLYDTSQQMQLILSSFKLTRCQPSLYRARVKGVKFNSVTTCLSETVPGTLRISIMWLQSFCMARSMSQKNLVSACQKAWQKITSKQARSRLFERLRLLAENFLTGWHMHTSVSGVQL